MGQLIELVFDFEQQLLFALAACLLLDQRVVQAREFDLLSFDLAVVGQNDVLLLGFDGLLLHLL